MAAVSTTTVSNRGEGSTQRTDFKSLKDTQRRTSTPGKVTRTSKPVKSTSTKSAAESVSTQEPAESQQVQREDYGFTIRFTINVQNFLNGPGGC